MKNQLTTVCENRLKQVLVMDKQINNSLLSVIKSDVLFILKNYMEISAEELEITLNLDEFGFYQINMEAKVRRLITFSRIPE